MLPTAMFSLRVGVRSDLDCLKVKTIQLIILVRVLFSLSFELIAHFSALDTANGTIKILIGVWSITVVIEYLLGCVELLAELYDPVNTLGSLFESLDVYLTFTLVW